MAVATFCLCVWYCACMRTQRPEEGADYHTVSHCLITLRQGLLLNLAGGQQATMILLSPHSHSAWVPCPIFLYGGWGFEVQSLGFCSKSPLVLRALSPSPGLCFTRKEVCCSSEVVVTFRFCDFYLSPEEIKKKSYIGKRRLFCDREGFPSQ